jgi:hypothetical protein
VLAGGEAACQHPQTLLEKAIPPVLFFALVLSLDFSSTIPCIGLYLTRRINVIRKIVFMITAILLFAVLLTACGPGGGPSPSPAGGASPTATQGLPTNPSLGAESTGSPAPGQDQPPAQGLPAYPQPGTDSSAYPAPGQDISAYNPYPGPSEGVNNYLDWAKVEELILGGKVSKVYHAQSMHITLVLKDGSVAVTIEPALDEIFKLIERCGQACSDIEQIKE